MCSDQRRLALGLYRTRLSPGLLDAAHNAGIEHLDCAYNYGDFAYLRQLGEMAATEAFSISSKVGYFPAPGGTQHSLDPQQLTTAAEHTAELLGHPADVLFLHNPEVSLANHPGNAQEQLDAACTALADAVSAGLAARWGIATWDADNHVLCQALDAVDPRPAAVMVRVGLAVPGPALQASGRLINRLALAPPHCWGMSPLGGSHAQDLIDAADYRTFVTGKAGNTQAALRVSYELPPVGTVCLSTSSPDHLREAAGALTFSCNTENLDRYRELIHLAAGRPASQPAHPRHAAMERRAQDDPRTARSCGGTRRP